MTLQTLNLIVAPILDLILMITNRMMIMSIRGQSITIINLRSREMLWYLTWVMMGNSIIRARCSMNHEVPQGMIQ